MPCYHPLTAFKSRYPNPATGKAFIKFNVTPKTKEIFGETHYIDWEPIQLPCGRCIGCRLERSRQWASRCVLEASLYDFNSFLTLTYSTENLPKDNSLNKEDFQKFMKRLRKNTGQKIRYFQCGEYGEINGRPHHHCILFNFDFSDKAYYFRKDGYTTYTSDFLDKTWGLGDCLIGSVTFESCAYVARYIVDKVLGPDSFLHYMEIDFDTGEIIHQQKKEFVTMSRRPGIGKPWLDLYKTDVYPNDSLIIRNDIITKPPKYFDRQLELTDPELYDNIKNRRIILAKNNPDNTYARLEVREHVKKAQIANLTRNKI